jgi:hypothetical protein
LRLTTTELSYAVEETASKARGKVKRQEYKIKKKREDMTEVIKHSKSVLSRLAYLICLYILDSTYKSTAALNNTITGVRLHRGAYISC